MAEALFFAFTTIQIAKNQGSEWLTGPVEDRSGRHRGLPAVLLAAPSAVPHPPEARVDLAAARAAEAVTPADPLEAVEAALIAPEEL
jgi:hypothetical protein